MLFLQSLTTDPYFNIATEEYLLKNFDQDFFFLYINEPSIIVGKHQNAVAEINVPYVIENDLKVVRRLSGGGTVFHDRGNLNYCFIQKGKEGFLVDFEKYSQPVLDTLKKLNVDAYLRGKSDLVIDDLKFSGNAEHVYKKKILHHGTMLFSSELGKLNEAIKVDWSKFNDRAVRSNRSVVTNISDHLDDKISINEFVEKVKQQVLGSDNEIEEYKLSKYDNAEIQRLIDEKYSTWKWNFGYSPKYVLQQSKDLLLGKVDVKLQIEKGIIKEMDINTPSLSAEQQIELCRVLIGINHEYYALFKQLDDFLSTSKNIPIECKELIKAFF